MFAALLILNDSFFVGFNLRHSALTHFHGVLALKLSLTLCAGREYVFGCQDLNPILIGAIFLAATDDDSDDNAQPYDRYDYGNYYNYDVSWCPIQSNVDVIELTKNVARCCVVGFRISDICVTAVVVSLIFCVAFKVDRKKA